MTQLYFQVTEQMLESSVDTMVLCCKQLNMSPKMPVISDYTLSHTKISLHETWNGVH